MKRILNVWPLAVLAVLLFFCAAFGQSPPDGAQVDPQIAQIPQIDGTSGTGGTSGSGIPMSGRMGLVAIIVPLLIAFLKPRLPLKWRKYVPLLAPILGEIITQIFTALPNGVGAVGGLAGVGVREAVKKKEAVVAVIGILFCALAGQACAVLDKAASKVTRAQVNTVTNTVVVTNLMPVAIPVPQPGETVFKTNFVERVFTNTVVEHHTNYVAKEGIAEGLQTARVGSAVAGVFNPGAGAIGTGVLGVLSAGLGYLVRRKNNEARDAREEAESLALQLQAAVEGVEKAGGVIDADDAKKVKETISKVSQALGVAAELHTSVKAITD